MRYDRLVTVRLSEENAGLLKREASENHVSVTYLVRHILRVAVQEDIDQDDVNPLEAMPRRKSGTENVWVDIAVRLSPDLLGKVDAAAIDEGESRAEFMRHIIVVYLEA